MSTKIKKLPLLLTLFALLIFISGSSIQSKTANLGPSYSGNWDFYFYDASGTLQGKKTIEISETGKISDKVILNLNNIIYNTEVYGIITPNGNIQDGDLTDTDNLEKTGVLAGTFTEEEGKGTWKNYYKTSGTWKATRSESKR